MIIENTNIRTSVRIEHNGVKYERCEVTNIETNLFVIKWGVFPMGDWDNFIHYYNRNVGWLNPGDVIETDVPELEQLYRSSIRDKKITDILK